MKYNVEVRVSLKKGMLNPEASTIQKALSLLDYKVEGTQTEDIIKFTVTAENADIAKDQVNEMCQKLLCNPVIHDYEVNISGE